MQILAWGRHSKNWSSLFAFTCTCKYQLRPSITSFRPCSCIWSFLSTEAALQAPRIVASDWTLCTGRGQSDFFNSNSVLSGLKGSLRTVDFWCWTHLEFQILGADQQEQGLATRLSSNFKRPFWLRGNTLNLERLQFVFRAFAFHLPKCCSNQFQFTVSKICSNLSIYIVPTL